MLCRLSVLRVLSYHVSPPHLYVLTYIVFCPVTSPSERHLYVLPACQTSLGFMFCHSRCHLHILFFCRLTPFGVLPCSCVGLSMLDIQGMPHLTLPVPTTGSPPWAPLTAKFGSKKGKSLRGF